MDSVQILLVSLFCAGRRQFCRGSQTSDGARPPTEAAVVLVSVNNSSQQVPISDHDRCVWPLVLRKVHVITGHLGAEVPTMDCEMCIQGIRSQPLDSSDQRGEGMNLVSYFTTKGFSGCLCVFICIHRQLSSSFAESVCLPCISSCLECHSLSCLHLLSVISQSFFYHSTGCLYMTDRVFLLCPQTMEDGKDSWLNTYKRICTESI